MIIKLEDATNPKIVGNKASSLSALMNLGLRVPSGFVVSFDEKNKSEVAKFIGKACDEKMLYAVRSSSKLEDSSEHSYAGLFDTFLGVQKRDLLKKIYRVMDTSKNKKIKEFCKRIDKKITDIKVSVIVQKLIDAEVSGICFTKNPVTGNRKQIIIEAGLGLGEYVVGNEITPDRYVVNREKFKIESKKIAAQHRMLTLNKNNVVEIPVFSIEQKMKDKKIVDLARISQKIEEEFKTPVDIEWCVSNDKLYILQSRPIIG